MARQSSFYTKLWKVKSLIFSESIRRLFFLFRVEMKSSAFFFSAILVTFVYSVFLKQPYCCLAHTGLKLAILLSQPTSNPPASACRILAWRAKTHSLKSNFMLLILIFFFLVIVILLGDQLILRSEHSTQQFLVCFVFTFIDSLQISQHAFQSHLFPFPLESALCPCNFPPKQNQVERKNQKLKQQNQTPTTKP